MAIKQIVFIGKKALDSNIQVVHFAVSRPFYSQLLLVVNCDLCQNICNISFFVGGFLLIDSSGSSMSYMVARLAMCLDHVWLFCEVFSSRYFQTAKIFD